MKKSINSKEDKSFKIDETNTKINWWIKKGFGAGGLKSYMFNTVLLKLNEYAAKYSISLGFSIKFFIDISKASKPFETICIDSMGDEVEYKLLSGGEKSRVDIVTILSLHDLLLAGNWVNILLFDEVFENLDEEGANESFQLLTNICTQEKGIFIITHMKNIDEYKVNFINVYKENNQTFIN